MSKVTIYYPEIVSFNILKLLDQLITHKLSIQIMENNKDVRWAKYEPDNQSIIFSNYTQNDIGEHTLSMSVYDDWFSRYFNSTIMVIISMPHPPSAVGKISNITAYQGQDAVVLYIEEGVFYNKNEVFTLTLSMWTDVYFKSKSTQSIFTEISDFSYYEFTFKKNFIGSWGSSLIAVDSFMQTSLVNFSIEVLKWTQLHWLYWNGPNITQWTEWVRGFIIDLSTGEWRVAEFYFESWIIILFVIVMLLITILSDQDVNVSYVLLESITLYWMLFLTFQENEWRIKQYFEQISVVLTHFNLFLFHLF